MTGRLGAIAGKGATRFAVRSASAEAMWLCLFDAGDRERRVAMAQDGDVWHAKVSGVGPGQRYGYRADGPWEPGRGRWFDAAKLLVDPYAVELDRRFAHDERLALHGVDTAALVPKAIVPAAASTATSPPAPPLFVPGGLVYEINVRGFTMRHPAVPEALRGTIGALAHPAVVAHLQRLGVDAVELMPIVAWIDERHLPARGLANAWGYNPVVPMALDPRLAPGGVAELVATVAALRAAGIGTILDLVFNHTGESDIFGPVLSLRGLDGGRYYTHAPDGGLVNDTGTGNTVDAAQPAVRALILDSLRHFARCGVEGFRFDLATVLARGPGFDADAPIFAEIAADPLLADRILIAEPWDIGPGGYQLGRFPASWLEWNDRFRDDVRRFWRGDGAAGTLATRLAGSSDLFHGAATRSVNFLAAHDGFTLADTVAYEHRHNEANGEDNRDGHHENFSWNHGHEGPSDDPAVRTARDADVRAMLATLFASRGTLLLAAGDELGRSQAGNNNAYAQDNELGWLDWDARDETLIAFVATLSAFRRDSGLADTRFLVQAEWRGLDGRPMQPGAWQGAQGFELRLPGPDATVLSLRVDRTAREVSLARMTVVDSRP